VHFCPRGGPPRIPPFRLSRHPRYSLGCVRASFGGCGPPALPVSSPCRRLTGMVPLRAEAHEDLERSMGGPGPMAQDLSACASALAFATRSGWSEGTVLSLSHASGTHRRPVSLARAHAREGILSWPAVSTSLRALPCTRALALISPARYPIFHPMRAGTRARRARARHRKRDTFPGRSPEKTRGPGRISGLSPGRRRYTPAAAGV